MGKTIVSQDGRFEWDEEQALINHKKHGLAFNEILPVFDDPYMLELYDDSHSTDREDRIRGIGALQGVLVLYTCYTVWQDKDLFSPKSPAKRGGDVL